MSHSFLELGDLGPNQPTCKDTGLPILTRPQAAQRGISTVSGASRVVRADRARLIGLVEEAGLEPIAVMHNGAQCVELFFLGEIIEVHHSAAKRLRIVDEFDLPYSSRPPVRVGTRTRTRPGVGYQWRDPSRWR